MVKSNQAIKTAKSIKLCVILNLVLALSNTMAYADNMDWFNKSAEAAKQHQFSLGLNANSNMDSFTKSNNLSSKIADGANAGTANSENMYTGQLKNDNYLSASGKQSIKDCENKQDPRCTTLNKYTDKDTQTQLQAYTSGISTRYQMTVAPDPTNKDCAIVKRKKPINETIQTCTSTQEQHTTQSQCNNTIMPNQVTTPQTPADGIVFTPIPNPMCGNVTDVTNRVVYGEASQYLFNYGTTVFVIKSNMSLFMGGKLPMFMEFFNGSFCGSTGGYIQTTPTTMPIAIGTLSVIHNVPITYYQDPGQNCGIDGSTTTCNIKIRLMHMGSKGGGWMPDEVIRSWVITFTRPVPASAKNNYVYNKGCS